MKNLFSILLFVLLTICGPEGFAQTPSSDSKERSDDLKRQSSVLKKLPDDVLNTEFQLLGGKTLKLSEHSGKPVLLNLFATWCGPCRLESPELAKLHEEFKDRGLVVIELSTEDQATSTEIVREWVEQYRLPYPVGWVPKEIALTLMQGRTSIPQAFVIAPDGRIVRRFIGYNPTMSPSQLREAVEEALK